MRISTAQLFQTGVTQINAQQAQLLGLYNQVSSGKQLTAPSDNPIGAARAVTLANDQSVNTQYATNRVTAEQNLNTEENTLQSVTTLFQKLQTEIVQAGSDTLSDSDRQSIGSVITTLKSTLLDLANATDANGQYLFSGYQGNVAPFASDATGAVRWKGDEGQRLIQVSTSRQMAGNDNGQALFMQAGPGDATYITAATGNTLSATTNQGTGIISTPTVAAPTDPTVGDNFTVKFSGSPLQYTVTDETTGATTVAATAYPPGGGTLALSPGVSVSLTGTPAAGDTFAVETAASEGPTTADPQNSSLNVFNSLDALAQVLTTPVGADDVKRAALHNTLTTVAQRIQVNYNAMLTVRASVGSRLDEVSSLNDSGSTMALNYTQQISSIEDVNYNTAITQLSLRQTALAAAQQAFVSIEGLNFFTTNAGK
ncbi:MAG: flagellar hook-associated protein 3 [Candidimonas sp.]|nr:MAG: flagellar hook-associated protein 3 [Candidimonas sp.]